MKIKNTDKCRCGHYKADHENRIEFKFNSTICWACAGLLLFNDQFNLDAYHSFKLANLEYLQKLYEKKHKVK